MRRVRPVASDDKVSPALLHDELVDGGRVISLVVNSLSSTLQDGLYWAS